MKEKIEQAKSMLMFSSERMLRNLAAMPDERVNWSPSSTARTAIHQVAHAAMSVTGIQFMLQLEPRLIGEFGKERNYVVEQQGDSAIIRYPFATVADIDIAFRNAERNYTTRDQVAGLLNGTVSEFYAFLDALTLEQFESTLHTHFGPVPMAFGITLPSFHTEVHIGQMEYIQTIYGDLERHP